MRINLENDYAFRIIFKFSNSPLGKKFRSKDLSEELCIPERFTYRILRKLLLNGLIASVRGPRGGYVLAKEPNEISMYDVYTAISGNLEINACMSGDLCEAADSFCPMHNELLKIQDKLISDLKKLTFEVLNSTN